MKAVLYQGQEKGVTIGEAEKPTPGPNDLLVKIKCSSLCHSDLMLLEGKAFQDELPRIPGHEACGYVEEVGSNVKDFKKGDAVGSLCYIGFCGDCDSCKVSTNACPQNKVQGFSTQGFFSEYTLFDHRAAMKLPEGLDPVSAAPLFCAGLTAFHGVKKCGLKPGEYIGIVGVGGLGHLAVQYAAKMGLKPIALDVDDGKLKHAKQIGAVEAFNTRDPELASKVREVTGGGCHATAVFSAAMPAYTSAMQTIRIGGLLQVVGLPSEPLQFNSTLISMGMLRIGGASSGRPEEMRECIEFSAKHGIIPKVKEYKLEQFNEMVDLMHKGQFEGRMVVVF